MIELGPADPSPTTLALAAGLALIDAVDEAVAGQDLMLKWPNDLLLGGDKLAGILLERSGDRVVAGFGVNLAFAPPLADRVAASLGGSVSPQEFAPLLAAAFAQRLARWRPGESEAIRADWLARAHPVGTPLSVHGAGSEPVSGTFAGIESDGALRLETPFGLQVIRAGDVEL